MLVPAKSRLFPVSTGSSVIVIKFNMLETIYIARHGMHGFVMALPGFTKSHLI